MFVYCTKTTTAYSLQLSLSLAVLKKDVNMNLDTFNFSLSITLFVFWWLKPSGLVFLHCESLFIFAFIYCWFLQPSVIYLSSSVCLTVLLVNLIYGFVAYVMNILHIIAELKKTEEKKMNSIGELFEKSNRNYIW